MDPSDELLFQVTILIPDGEQSEQGFITFRPDQPSDESLYEAATQFSDGRMIKSNGY